MSNLSPAAQAVLDAFGNTRDGEYIDGVWVVNERTMLAAALRAVVYQCKIEWNYHPDYPKTESVVVVSDLLSIATELEAQP